MAEPGRLPVPQPNKLSTSRQGTRHRAAKNRFKLTNTKADVIFAFYGYGESFAGEAGSARSSSRTWKTSSSTRSSSKVQRQVGSQGSCCSRLSRTSSSTIAQSAQQIEVVDATNTRLKMYSQAMGEAAKANGVKFVDLFACNIGNSELTP